jgi:Fe2+ or Zn2+ uptake regulation protein
VHWLKDFGLVSQTDMAGTVIDIEDSLFDGLRHQLSETYGFRARIDHMAIYGWCARCAVESSES